jgi:hypothetical protein
MVGLLGSQFSKAAKRMLRGCRGNIEDVQQGPIFQNFLQQHNLTDEDIEPNISESTRGEPEQYEWLTQLMGGEYGSQMPDAPLYDPPYSQLSMRGVWESGQGSGTATRNVGESGQSSGAAAGDDEEDVRLGEDPTLAQLRRTTRVRTAPTNYTPSAYPRGRGRGTAPLQPE